MDTELSDDDREALLADCAELYTSATRGFNTFLERLPDPPYSQTSPAVQWARAASENIGPRGAWPEDLIDRLTRRVMIYMIVSQRYLISMHALTLHNPYGPGLAPLARCIAEATGKTAWLLDNKLGLTDRTRERVARLLLDEEDDSRRRKTLMIGLSHPDRAKAGDDHRASRDAVAKPTYFHPSEIKTDASGTVMLRGESLPGPAQLVRTAESILDKSPGGAEFVYGYLSAVAHPTMFAYLEVISRDDVIFCAKLANYAVLSFHDGWRMFSAWIDHDFPEADAVRELHSAIAERIQLLQPSL